MNSNITAFTTYIYALFLYITIAVLLIAQIVPLKYTVSMQLSAYAMAIAWIIITIARVSIFMYTYWQDVQYFMYSIIPSILALIPGSILLYMSTLSLSVINTLKLSKLYTTINTATTIGYAIQLLALGPDYVDGVFSNNVKSKGFAIGVKISIIMSILNTLGAYSLLNMANLYITDG